MPSPALRKRSALPLPKLIVPTSSNRLSSRKVRRHSRCASSPSLASSRAVDAVDVDLRDERRARRRRARGQHAGREPGRMAAELHRERDVAHPAEHARRAARAASGISLVVRLGYGRSVLVGREGELRRVTALLDEARRGRSGTLVVVGDPGLGKTALLEEARAAGRPTCGSSAATGVEIGVGASRSRACTSCSARCSTCCPASRRRRRGRWRPRSRSRKASRTRWRSAPGRCRCSSRPPRRRPSWSLLDDAHWLDRASADALAFAARRLIGGADRRAGRVPSRPRPTPFEALPAAGARAARPEDAPPAAGDAQRARSPPADEARVLAAAAGNPLALLELPVELARDLPVSADVARAAAADVLAAGRRAARGRRGSGSCSPPPSPTSATVRRAASAPGSRRRRSPPAEAAGLVRVGAGDVAFRHPVVRSLVYSNAPGDRPRRRAPGSRRRAVPTSRTATAAPGTSPPPPNGADEAVAALLEETAERATARGGHAAAAHVRSSVPRASRRTARTAPGGCTRRREPPFWAGDAAQALASWPRRRCRSQTIRCSTPT